MKLSVLGICAGNGVVLYPFKDNLIGNIEPRSAFKTPKNEQWESNFPNIPLHIAYMQYVKPDIILGHPDCGHSSVLAYSRGKKFSNPRDNKSLTLFIQSINQYNPKIFLMENLPALLKTYGEEELATVFPNYHLKFLKGSVSKWGNSQISRKRLVIIGLSKKYDPQLLKIFKFDKGLMPLKTTGELLKGLKEENEELGHVRLPLKTRIAMFGGCKLTLKEIKKGWKRSDNKKRWATGENKMKNAPGVYRNLNKDYPLTVRKGNREFNQKGLILTPRERARIQGILDEFKIVFDPRNPTYYINKGNITVTKCFPMEISKWFKRKLIKFERLTS